MRWMRSMGEARVLLTDRPPLLCRRNGWIIPVGTSMFDVHMTLFVMFNPLLQEVINCKFPTKLCQSSPLNHIQSKCGRCISVAPTPSRRILHLCPITRAKNDNKVSGIYLVDGGGRNDTAFAASAMTLAMYN